MKNILGLDLGTNSIGWAMVEEKVNKQSKSSSDISVDENVTKTIIAAGSRIIPMDAAQMGDYEKGNLQSAAADRTGFRGTRRLYERSILRRERLLRVLNVMDFLPEHFKEAIDFKIHFGKFKDHGEPLLAYAPDENGKKKFLFMDSFNEMLDDFRINQPELVAGGRLVPYDWTIYYLRKKALSQPITKQELAWIILNFNTKRGYYQRSEDADIAETQPTKTEEYAELRVTDVTLMEEDKKRKGSYWFEITYENETKQRSLSPSAPRKIGDIVQVIITTNLDKDGNVKIDKEGNKKITLRTPKEEDWTLMKKRSEHIIDKSGGTVGEYIYNTLLSNPNTKVRGKLIHTIERKYYRDELTRILRKQSEFLPELRDDDLFTKCVNELYRSNTSHAESLKGKGFTNFFVEDIIFYHRPLKSKKSLISDCQFEKRHWIDPMTGDKRETPLKCIPKSHPLFQEFRLWQFVSNLRIRKKELGVDEKNDDVTSVFLPDNNSKAALFDWLNERKEIKQDQLLKYKPFGLGKNASDYRWNYPEDKTYPCNETLYEINQRLKKTGTTTLSNDEIFNLWHIAASVSDPIQYAKALSKFAERKGIDSESFLSAFKNWNLDSSSYGAYSEKAIKRLLPLMRTGSHWSWEAIDGVTRSRIMNIVDGVYDENITDTIREKCRELDSIDKFNGLPVWLASYVVYGRHSEASDMTRWTSPDDIDSYLKNNLRQHSLRNPVVEKVVAETLCVARDLWRNYGKIDEVHVEMGRDLKNDAETRKKISDSNVENERTNFRIRALLQEFANKEYNIADVRPNSPMQQEILKIFENNILNDDMIEVPDDIRTLVNDLGNATRFEKISHNQIMRYRLWLEQKYMSPYTGKLIPLSRLFTTEYQIEHVIPQSRYYDDSISNKVICESEVNKLKGNMLGYEFILNKGGDDVTVWQKGKPETVCIFVKEQYVDFVNSHYSKNRKKREKLLMQEIPDSFIERQLNDTRYMSRKIKEILSMLVREEGEQEATSKNLITTSGSITDRLKKDWGLKDVWNRIISPRFQRLNKMTGTSDYGQWVERDGKRFFQINVPLSISSGFSTKRIDHRHHAMDAIVIACTSRDIVHLLNNESAKSNKAYDKSREGLRHKLCYKKTTDSNGNYVWLFRKPSPTFTADTHRCLEEIIVSFKQNLRIINKMTNHYTHFDDQGNRIVSRQTKGDGWAIRKSLHKATVSGLVRLQTRKTLKLADALKEWHNICDRSLRHTIKDVVALYKGKVDAKTLTKFFKDRGNKIDGKDISKVDVWRFTEGKDAMTASRVNVDTSFDQKTIEKITDSGIRKIMLAHLERCGNDPVIAFSPEGIANMNQNIRELNGGKDHKPIIKVRKAEVKGMKFPVGEIGTKSKKYVEADKGTNLFFAIYANSEGKRSFESTPFNEAVESLKKGMPVAPETNENGEKLLFTLSPNDLVYVPDSSADVNELNVERIYKMVSCTGNKCLFVPISVATIIANKFEFEALNKMERALDGKMIKQCCQKLLVDRLGNITKIIK